MSVDYFRDGKRGVMNLPLKSVAVISLFVAVTIAALLLWRVTYQECRAMGFGHFYCMVR